MHAHTSQGNKTVFAPVSESESLFIEMYEGVCVTKTEKESERESARKEEGAVRAQVPIQVLELERGTKSMCEYVRNRPRGRGCVLSR